tara:strand:+ start:2172 stop:3158 length:987 start_codon:yes stop_codon:yes gene_type:complete
MSLEKERNGNQSPARPSPLLTKKVAILLPCLNEAAAIAQVIEDFRNALPESEIFVYDNSSTDDTADIASKAGALVRKESARGKGHVVRRMLGEVDADIYLMADGDGTYDAASAPRLIRTMIEGSFDMVVGARQGIGAVSRTGHEFGNRLFNWLLMSFFGHGFKDLFSGYRVFSRRFAKTFPVSAKGFEIETEMCVHALELGIPVCEISLPYNDRVAGGYSKLRTYKDGLRILLKMLLMLKDVRPLFFFSTISVAFFVFSIGLAMPILIDYLETGFVPRLPTVILASALGILGFISLTSGIVLDSVARGNRQIKRMLFLMAGSAPRYDD